MLSSVFWVVITAGLAACLSAFTLGTNNFCNGWATSVGARTLTLHQATIIGGLMEFTGAVGLGGHSTRSLVGNVVDSSIFTAAPMTLIYGLTCALLSAATWQTLTTYWSLPVSMTHSITAATVGMAMVYRGSSAVVWAQPIPDFPFFKGMVPIFASWVTSPMLSGLASALMFWTLRSCILRSTNSLDRSFIALPMLVFVASFIDSFFVLYKGASASLNWGIYTIALVSCILSFVSTVFTIFVVQPYLRNRVLFDQRQRQSQHAAEASLKERHHEEPECERDPAGPAGVTFAKAVTLHGADGSQTISSECSRSRDTGSGGDSEDEKSSQDETESRQSSAHLKYARTSRTTHRDAENDGMQRASSPGDSSRGLGEASHKGSKALLHQARLRVVRYLRRGRPIDVFQALQEDPWAAAIHARAEVFDKPTEHSFKYLQVFSAMCFSLSHGANDIANSAGPFTVILVTYQTSQVNSMSSVPTWVLVVLALILMFGCLSFGYRNVKAMGIRLVYISPCRGFCTQLASALVSALGARYGIPLSTTHCQVGACVGVGLLDGVKGVNWRLLGRFCLAWVATVLCCAGFAALLFAQGFYAPGQSSHCLTQVAGLNSGVASASHALLQAAQSNIRSLQNVTRFSQAANNTLTAVLDLCAAPLVAKVADSTVLLRCLNQALALLNNVTSAQDVLQGSNTTAIYSLRQK